MSLNLLWQVILRTWSFHVCVCSEEPQKGFDPNSDITCLLLKGSVWPRWEEGGFSEVAIDHHRSTEMGGKW